MARWRSAIAVGVVGALLVAAGWAAGSSVLLRSGRLTALRHISAPTASQPSAAPVGQSSRLPTQAPPRALSLPPSSSVNSGTCEPWLGTLTLNNFGARAVAPGTVSVTWAASDRCPPYTGNIKVVYSGTGINGPFQRSYTVNTLSGAISDKFDCSLSGHVTGATYFLGLWDSTNHMIQAASSIAVC